MSSDFYSFKPESSAGKAVSMKTFEGRVVLVVNTASRCGFTPQYSGLQKLYETYKDRGLVILGFPCDQFAHQEPGTDAEIQQFCSLNFGVTFPVLKKVRVNGRNADPVFKFLKKMLPGKLGGRIRWNFTKFLIDRNGRPVKRFSPSTKPEEIEKDIQALL